MFLWWIALRNCPFIYGTWFARRYRCFSRAWIFMTEDSKCCWAHAISSTSSKISHTWKGTLLRSLLKSSWSKCFMDLYVIRRLLDWGAWIFEMTPVRLWKSLIPVSIFMQLQKLLCLFVRNTSPKVGFSPLKHVGPRITFFKSYTSHRSWRILSLNMSWLISPKI